MRAGVWETMGKQIGLPLRAGLHTGEIELRGRDVGGVAVHAAARVRMAHCAPGEVLVSEMVTDLARWCRPKIRRTGVPRMS